MTKNIETLTFLGTDSGFGQKNNSAFIENEECFTLIDCGFSIFTTIINRFDFKKYKTINVIITHLHNDHAGSLSQFILYLWFVCNKKANIISNCKRIKEYLDITGTPQDSYNLMKEMTNIEFIKTEHVDYIDSYGFKININGRKILYTGDTNTLKPFMNFLNDINEFYIDVSKYGGAHLKIDEIIENLKLISSKNINICTSS